MSNNFTLKASKRDDLGKGASRRLRRVDQTPAVIYGGGEDAVSVSVSHFEMLKNLNNDAFYSQIIEIDLEGEVIETVLRDLQRHPYKPVILHADFQRVVRGQEISVNVPIHLLNADKAVGIKAGGILNQHIIDVEISCRPSKLPQALEVDILSLEIGDSIKLSDIPLPEGVSIPALVHEDHDTTVLGIHPPKTEAVETEEASAEEAAEKDSEA